MTRVLIADDSRASREQVAAVLSAVENAVVSFAGNGAEALRVMANETYDLLLCDIEMPIMNGIQLVAAVRSRASRYELPILVLTGRTTTADMTTAFRAGVNDYVTKPVNSDELLARVTVQLELRRLQKNVVEAQRVALERRKLESVGQLAAGIAHEMNTPIQYIRDNLEFLRGSFDDILQLCGGEGQMDAARRHATGEIDLEWLASEIPRAIEQAVGGAERVAALVCAMKDFARVDANGKSRNDLNRMLQSTVAVCASTWREVAAVTLNLGDGVDSVPCRPAELNQAFMNVILNATQAVAARWHSNGEGKIEIRTSCADGCALVTVEDNGEGIPDAIADRIYDPFFTTREVGKGAGQGLTIARSCIVDRHGGAIDFRSAPGAGTTFTIRLPLDDTGATEGA
jgi:signal transduction histidine kinase